MKAIIFDTETTGLTLPTAAGFAAQPRIIEIGAIKLDVNDGRATAEQEFSQLLDPGETLEAVITKITGIRDSDLVGQPRFEDVVEQLAEFFAGVEVLIAHNAPFDVTMLKSELLRAGAAAEFPVPPQVICTVHEFRAFFGHDPKLVELYELALGEPLKQTHRAIDDCRALMAALDSLSFWGSV
jgi:DNA polymerase III epsilon subunit family exonuclease